MWLLSRYYGFLPQPREIHISLTGNLQHVCRCDSVIGGLLVSVCNYPYDCAKNLHITLKRWEWKHLNFEKKLSNVAKSI